MNDKNQISTDCESIVESLRKVRSFIVTVKYIVGYAGIDATSLADVH